MKKILLFSTLFLGSSLFAQAITNCDDQAKPALDCPAGYTMMCVPVGGDHWSCGKESDGVIIESSSAAETTGVKSTMQTQVRVEATSSEATIESSGAVKEGGSSDRLLPTVNKINDSSSNSSSRVLPTVNKKQVDNSSNRLLPTVNKKEENASSSARLLPTVNKRADQKVTVRGWDPQKKEEISGMAETQIAENEDIKAVDISEDTVKIDYSAPAKLFGIFPMKIGLSVAADAQARVKVKFPWYRFLLSTNTVDIQSEFDHVYQHNQTDLEFLKMQDTVARQSEIFQALSNVLKARHDASIQIISNIK